MTYNELYEMISKKFHLIRRPSDQELNLALQKLLVLYDQKGFVTDTDLLNIINMSFSNHQMHLNESVDMTSTINIANQIIAKYKNSTQG